MGSEVVPVLRKEFDAKRPAHVPEAPTHASLKAAAERARELETVSPEVVGLEGTR